MTPLLLDTCAAIWLAEDEPVADAAVQALNQAAGAGVAVFVSPMSAWELGMLVAKGRLTLAMTPLTWFERLLRIPGMQRAELDAETLIAASFLPGEPPPDPADRIIAATARAGGYRLVTRDRRLLAYAEQGHLAALAC